MKQAGSMLAWCGLVVAQAACGGGSGAPVVCPASVVVEPGGGASEPGPGDRTPPDDGGAATPTPTARTPYTGMLLFDDSDHVRAVDVHTTATAPFQLTMPLALGQRNVAAGAATWVSWNDADRRQHSVRLTHTADGLAVLLADPIVDDVSPDGTLAIIRCPKKAGATCMATLGTDGFAIPAPIKWPKGAGRVHGWTTAGNVLVVTSSLRTANLIEFEPRTGKSTPRGALPADSQAFFDRAGAYVAWFQGGNGKDLTLVFRRINDKTERRLALGVARDAQCEATPANDGWACMVFTAQATPGRLIVADLATLAVRELATNIDKVFGPFTWSPTGDAIAIAANQGDKSALQVVPLAGGAPITVWIDDKNFISRPRPLGWLQ